MTALDDRARFFPDDPTALVVAAFSCPLCLRQASLVFLEEDEQEHTARCWCKRCTRTWMVAMTADQHLRVMLLPPRLLPVLGGA